MYSVKLNKEVVAEYTEGLFNFVKQVNDCFALTHIQETAKKLERANYVNKQNQGYKFITEDYTIEFVKA